MVADALREKQPKLGALMDASREDVLAYMDFPREHWPQIASTNPLERVNREIKRRADVVGIFPNDEAIIRLVGALMLETNDEWAVARRYMSLETSPASPNIRPSGCPPWPPDTRPNLSEDRRSYTITWDMTRQRHDRRCGAPALAPRLLPISVGIGDAVVVVDASAVVAIRPRIIVGLVAWSAF